MDSQALIDMSKGLLLSHGLNVLYAAITLVIGLWIIRIITRVTGKALERTKVELSLRKFLLGLVSIVLKTLLAVSVVAQLGVATTSFVAILGAAGLAVGLALQGSLANFAGGVLILLFKPYKIGDFIDAQGIAGKVKEIQVFNTVVTTPDNKTVIVPNGAMSNGIITNFSTQPMRRVDMSFGIGYNDDIDRAKALLDNLVTADTRILKDPAPQIAVSELGDSSVNFVVRVWCNTADYWEIFFAMQEDVKKTFDQNSISIPFPQRDVHLYKH
jgi:small conductance mechanosensitive channel